MIYLMTGNLNNLNFYYKKYLFAKGIYLIIISVLKRKQQLSTQNTIRDTGLTALI